MKQHLCFSLPVYLTTIRRNGHYVSAAPSVLTGDTYETLEHKITLPVNTDRFRVFISHHSSRNFLEEWATTTTDRREYDDYVRDEQKPTVPYPLIFTLRFKYENGESNFVELFELPGSVGYTTREIFVPRVKYYSHTPHTLTHVSAIAKATSENPHRDFDFDQHGEVLQVSVSEFVE